MRAGDQPYCSNGDCRRWGDYLGAAVDPKFPNCVWLVSEYAKSGVIVFNWGTYIAATSHSIAGGTDTDCDNWSDTAESIIGTDGFDDCADNSGDNAWPADVNNDTISDITDIATTGASFGKAVPPAPARHNVAPDPPDGVVDITDIATVGLYFGKGCGSPGSGGASAGPAGPAGSGPSPKLSLDMDPTGNSYADSTNTMSVGPVDSCLTSVTGNNSAHNHTAHLLIQDVQDLVGWQARLNYDGGKMRPRSVNFAPFWDANTSQNISFLNLPIDQCTVSHRSLFGTSSIPPAAPAWQTALMGASYQGEQNAAISPDTPPKVPPDDTSYSAPTGGVLAAIDLHVSEGMGLEAWLPMDLDDGNPYPPGSKVVLFTDSGITEILLPEDALKDGVHTEWGNCPLFP